MTGAIATARSPSSAPTEILIQNNVEIWSSVTVVRCTAAEESPKSRKRRNFAVTPQDSALVISSSGCNVVPIEMAEQFQKRGLRVVAIVSLKHSQTSTSKRADGKKLPDFADLVLDTGAPAGDAMVKLDGLDTPVAPGSTVGGSLLVNSIKAEVALRLTQAGQPPLVLSGANVVGARRATEIFEAAYDEHSRRLAKLYQIPEA